MVERVQHIHSYGKTPEPFKVKLMKMSKGYQWEISVSGDSISNILGIIGDVDEQLRETYEPVEAV
jgi:hypothetical protein